MRSQIPGIMIRTSDTAFLTPFLCTACLTSCSISGLEWFCMVSLPRVCLNSWLTKNVLPWEGVCAIA